jgi:membrane-bound metal-dependent hydrolase YbcI (DUF457 family)
MFICSDKGVRLWPVTCLFMYMAAYTQPDWCFFFFRETFTCFFVLLQILKSEPTYFYTTVKIMWWHRKLVDCFFSQIRSKNSYTWFCCFSPTFCLVFKNPVNRPFNGELLFFIYCASVPWGVKSLSQITEPGLHVFSSTRVRRSSLLILCRWVWDAFFLLVYVSENACLWYYLNRMHMAHAPLASV